MAGEAGWVQLERNDEVFMIISKWNIAGCAITSAIMASAAWSSPKAVNVTDLGCGPENCGQDQRGDIVWHDSNTG